MLLMGCTADVRQLPEVAEQRERLAAEMQPIWRPSYSLAECLPSTETQCCQQAPLTGVVDSACRLDGY